MRKILLYMTCLVLVFLLIVPSSAGQKCGVLTFTVTAMPNITTGTSCQGHFTAEATFDPTAPTYACPCCEFRQKVKGKLLKDGNKLTVKVLGPKGAGPHPEFVPTGFPTEPTNLSETDYQEDYIDYGDGDGPGRYGHRNEDSKSEDAYTKGGSGADATTKDPTGGCKYNMTDKPGFETCDSGHKYEVDLYFEDKIITTCELCDGCKAIETHITVQRTMPPPATPPPPPPPKPKTGIGPDFTSLIVFFLLAAGWILFVVRKKYRTV